MIDSKKAKDLVAELKQKTDAKRIEWEPTANLDEFVATFRGRVTFTISKYEERDSFGNSGGDSYKLVMRDAEGRELSSLSSTNRTGEMEVGLSSLYEGAHDSALKVDETIDSILENLREA